MVNGVGVLISGSGSNLNAIIKNDVNVKFVVSNNPNAYGLNIAKNANIPSYCYKSLQELEKNVYKLHKEHNTKLLVLAGFMRLLSKSFIERMPDNHIINIHPSLLPKFKGAHAIEQALQENINHTGVTVHFVDEGMDTGPVIIQEEVEIAKDDTTDTLHKKVQKVEHRLYSYAIKYLLN